MNAYSTKIYGHRGASEYAPENSMEAFKLAYEMGANGIELDVQLSKDGQLVVIHDETLNRTSNGSGYVKDYTLKELRELDFSNSFSDYNKIKIPTLYEVLEEFREKDFLINIELKNSVIHYPDLEQLVLSCVAEFHYLEQTIFSSFSHPSMLRLRMLQPKAKIGFLVSDEIIDIVEYLDKYKVDRIHPPLHLCNDKEMIDMYHKSGKEVNIWTVNAGSDMRKYCDMGVDGIITNRVDLGVEIQNDCK